MHMIPVGADLQELELIASLDPQTDVSQRLVDRRIEHGSSIFGWKHQVVEQNRNVMALVDVEAHPRDLRRKRRGMHPKGFSYVTDLARLFALAKGWVITLELLTQVIRFPVEEVGWDFRR